MVKMDFRAGEIPFLQILWTTYMPWMYYRVRKIFFKNQIKDGININGIRAQQRVFSTPLLELY